MGPIVVRVSSVAILLFGEDEAIAKELGHRLANLLLAGCNVKVSNCRRTGDDRIFLIEDA